MGDNHRKTSAEKQEQQRKRDLLIGIVLSVVGYGLGTVSVVWSSMCWSVAGVFALHALSTFECFDLVPSHWKFGIGTAMFALGWICASGFVSSAYRTEQSSSLSGRLEPAEKHSSLGVPIVMEIGQSGSVIDWVSQAGQPQWKVFADSKIRLEDEDGALKLTTEIRDDHDRLVVKIVKNEWTIPQQSTQVWDKNFTSDSLEVIDGRGHVALQVRVLKDRIQLQGEWHDERGDMLKLVDMSRYPGLYGEVLNGHAYVIPTGWDQAPIRSMFVYPSYRCWAIWRIDNVVPNCAPSD